MKQLHLTAAVLFLALLTMMSGCSAKHYKESADRQAYAIIDSKSTAVPGMPENLRIDQPVPDPLEGLPPTPPELLLGAGKDKGADGEEPRLINLESALSIAAVNSREYQQRKEAVFLRALALTDERNRFLPQFFWNLRGDAEYDNQREEGWSVEGSSGPGMEWLLATGARLSAELSTTTFRFLSGDPSRAAGSVLDLTLTQPLLRDSRIATIEPLTQAERDMIYELRDFVRFQRRFSVSVLDEYYRVLDRRQRVENENINYENLARIRRRSEALGEAGRLPELEVDRARQDELSASDSLDQALQSYQQALDDFKMTLGIRPDAAVVLDLSDLQTTGKDEVTPPPVSRRESIEIALENRLDLTTAKEQVEDAERKVKVAINALKPGLDLILGATAATTQENRVMSFGDSSRTGFAALDLDLPLERTSERNIYRRRLVELTQARRAFEQQRDEVILEVTNRWRDFDRALSSYQIQKRSVDLAQKRVESTELLLNAGRAIMRDVLDAREDLLDAQNRASQALVDLRVSTLELERDMDILVVDENGQLQEGAGYNDIQD